MKKVLCLIMVLGILVACGGNGRPDDISEPFYDDGVYLLGLLEDYSAGKIDEEDLKETCDLFDEDGEDLKETTMSMISNTICSITLNSSHLTTREANEYIEILKEYLNK